MANGLTDAWVGEDRVFAITAAWVADVHVKDLGVRTRARVHLQPGRIGGEHGLGLGQWKTHVQLATPQTLHDLASITDDVERDPLELYRPVKVLVANQLDPLSRHDPAQSERT
jgi:hypothetical protein